MSILQQVHLQYGYKPGDDGQPIPVIDRTVGGEGLKIYFSEDLEDPYGHHSNAGGISLINGPNSSTGFDIIDCVISLWVCDLWAPSADYRTECQMWMSLCEVLPGGGSGATVKTFPAQEWYAPIQHDDLLWELDPVTQEYVVVPDAAGHDPSVKHVKFKAEPLFVPANRRLRAHIGQFHGSNLVPGYGKPYPGHIRRAWADMYAVPR